MSFQNIKESLYRFYSHLGTMDLYRGLLICFAIAFPIIVGVYTDHLEIGMAIGFGAFACSPSDVNGSKRNLINALLISSTLVFVVSAIAHYLPSNLWLQAGIIGILLFLISLLSIFGFRASLISFSGTFALVLSFAFRAETIHPIIYAALIGLGGIWYLFLALIWYRIIQKKPIDEALSKTLHLTAQYIQTRAELLEPSKNRDHLLKQLYDYQIQLGEQHEALREMLIMQRQSFGKSGYFRKRTLLLIELIDIFELALSHPVNYAKMDHLFANNYPPIQAFKKLMEGMSQQLQELADIKNLDQNYHPSINLQDLSDQVCHEIDAYIEKRGVEDEGGITLRNYYKYQEQQIATSIKILWLLQGQNLQLFPPLSEATAQVYVTQENYSFQILIDSFSFNNIIVKHALRLAVIAIIGFLIGNLFQLQNPYWILLTIIVILRPNYGLTRSRAKARIIGTIIGGLIALGIVYFIHNPWVYAVLGTISMVLALMMFKHNYQTAAAFVTLNIVFVYSLLQPNAWEVIQFRIIDTAIGAALSSLGIIYLWPSWEQHNIHTVIAKSIQKNQTFFKEITQYYERKSPASSYILARKQAFLAVSDLSAAFQRMTQEPNPTNEELQEVYAFVTLNQAFLSGLASISTFIRTQPTTAASDHFLLAAKNINENLNYCKKKLNSDSHQSTAETSPLSPFLQEENTEKFLEKTFEKTNYRDALVLEKQLIINQLQWLYSLSQQMRKRVDKF